MCRIAKLIDQCAERRSHMSMWERRFIASTGDMIDKRIPLTSKQITLLEGIWERVKCF